MLFSGISTDLNNIHFPDYLMSGLYSIKIISINVQTFPIRRKLCFLDLISKGVSLRFLLPNNNAFLILPSTLLIPFACFDSILAPQFDANCTCIGKKQASIILETGCIIADVPVASGCLLTPLFKSPPFIIDARSGWT